VQINGVEALVMLAYYAAFVVYIVVHERKRANAMHIEESRHFQEAYRLARELAMAENVADAAETVRALEALPPSVRARALLDEVPAAFSHHAPGNSGSSNGIFGAARALGRSVTLDPRNLAAVLSAAENSSDSEPLLGERDASQSVSLALAGSRQPSGVLSVAQALSEMSWSEILEMPVVALLRLTMPEVGLADTVRYPKLFAVVLPVTAPLFVVLGKRLALIPGAPLGLPALLYGLLCSLFSSAVIYSIYPRSGRHYGILSGFFTGLTFSMSILWMDVAASEMVRAWKSVGYIHGLSQQMLGVTVLAWANSFGDAVANVAMAVDGFPSMAIAACFASPFFTMVGGLGIAFSMSVLLHGTLHFTVELPLTTALWFLLLSTLRHVVLVPSLLKWRLGYWAAIGMIAFYACFQVMYIIAISAS
jgi:Ca2+/Na+ antiporter